MLQRLQSTFTCSAWRWQKKYTCNMYSSLWKNCNSCGKCSASSDGQKKRPKVILVVSISPTEFLVSWHPSPIYLILVLYTSDLIKFKSMNAVMVRVKLIFTLHATDWLWGTLCAVCTRRWKHFAIEPSLTRGWRWTEWNSPGQNTAGRCSGWRMYLRNWTPIHRNRWRNSARFVKVHLSITDVTDNIFMALINRMGSVG